VICVDAAGTGWVAYVQTRIALYEVKQGWREFMRHSAHAEPIAASEAIRWARRKLGQAIGRVALITDHSAMPAKQRSHVSGNGGFSRAWFLNGAYRELYTTGNSEESHDMFHIDGSKNPVDAASRETMVGACELRWREVAEAVMPDVRLLAHPHSDAPSRPRWCV